MLKLKDIEITNFRSWKSLSLNFEDLGLVLLKAQNGAGKSAIRHAIEILFTNKTSDGIPVDELSFNKSGNYKLKAHIIRDSDFITIINERKKDKPNIQLFINNEDLSETDSRETQNKIINILGLDKNILSYSNIFSSNSPAFAESLEKDRKDIIYSICNLDRYNKYLKNCKDKIREIDDIILSNESKLDIKKQDIIRLEEELKSYELKSLSFENDQTLKINVLRGSISSIKLKINTLKQQEQIPELRPFSESKKEELQDGISLLNKEITKLESAINYLNKELRNISDGTCPIFEDKCDRLYEQGKTKKEVYSNKVLELKGKLIEENSIKEHKINEFKTILNDEAFNNQMIEDQKDIDNDIKTHKNEILNIEKSIDEISNSDNIYSFLVEDTKILLNSKKDDIIVLESLNKELNEKLKYYKFWEVGYSKSGIPNKIADDFLSSLEYETNKCLSEFDSNITVSIESQHEKKDKSFSEKVSYKIYHPDKTITDYKSYSSGQRQRVNIANLLAFNNLLGNFNFIIFDEILDAALDDPGKQDVINILKTKANELDTILVISHSSQIQDSFDSVIEIGIKNGVSYLK